MSPEADESAVTPSTLMHDTINQVSTIMSIAQFCLISKEISPEVQMDLKRIIEVARQVADNLKHLAEILEEEEED